MSVFKLAHLSDPHLGPLAGFSLHQLIGKRVTGYVNWRRKRRHAHDMDILARIVADIHAQAPDPVSYTHLDVYKRQVKNRATSGGPQPAEMDRMLAEAIQRIDRQDAWIKDKRARIAAGLAKLDADFGTLAKNAN